MNDTERQRLFDTVRSTVLEAIPDVWAVYAHGSLVKGEERPDSDLDLAVLLPPGKRIPNLLELIAQLSTAIGREVDIADLRRAGNFLRKEVLADGITLYSARPDEVLAWEGHAISEYAEHRERIRDLLEDFNRTGVGYAP